MLNEKALELLGIKNGAATVAFSFENGIQIMNGDQQGIPAEFKINVTKTPPRKVTHKRTFEYIIKSLELDQTVENEFKLELNPTNDEGIVTASFKSMDSMNDVQVDENTTNEIKQANSVDEVMGDNAVEFENDTAVKQETFSNETSDEDSDDSEFKPASAEFEQ